MSLVPPLIRAPLLAVVFWWVAWSLGLRISKWLRYPGTEAAPTERAFVCLALGIGFLQYVPYGLGVAGILSRTSLRVAWLVLMVVLVRDLWEVAKGLARIPARLKRLELTTLHLVWLGLFVLVMSPLVLHALGTGPMGEDDGYHLAAPKRWLQSGTLHYLPTYTTTNLPLNFEMLYAFGLAVGGPTGVKLIHVGAGLLTFFGLWLAGRRLGAAMAGIVALSLLMIANPVVNLPFLFRLAYVDFGATTMVIATVLVWLIWREERDHRALVVMALFAGFAITMKLTAVCVLAAWAPILVWEARKQSITWNKIALATLKLGSISIAPVVPWLVRNWRNTGNPIFPMLAGPIPTLDWDARVARDLGLHARLFSWGLVAGSSLTEGQRKLIVVGVAGAILLLGALVAWKLRRPPLRALTLFATAMVLAAIGIGGLVFRYWLPGVMCAVLVAAVWAHERWPSVRLQLGAACALLALSLLAVLRSYRTDVSNDARLAAGLATMDQIYSGSETWLMWKFINAETPPDSRLLLAAFYPTYGAGNFGNFWTDRACLITDAHAQGHVKLNDFRTFTAGIRADHVTHVVISSVAFSPDRYGYRFLEATNEYPFSRRLVDEAGERLVRFGNLELYRLRPEKLEPLAAVTVSE